VAHQKAVLMGKLKTVYQVNVDQSHGLVTDGAMMVHGDMILLVMKAKQVTADHVQVATQMNMTQDSRLSLETLRTQVNHIMMLSQLKAQAEAASAHLTTY
jgi:hypothetical protein